MEDPDLEEEDSGIICDAGEDDMDIALDDLLDEDAGIGEAVEGELAAAAAPAPGGHAIYVQRISVPEYEQKGHDYTKQAIAALLQSEDYQRKNKSCHSCQACWYDEQFSLDCPECGSYALSRPCPICRGKCAKIWRRDVDMSHAMAYAHWDGTCGLPEHEREAYMFQYFTEASEESIMEAMEDLSTT